MRKNMQNEAQLHERILDAIVRDTGASRQMAHTFVESVMQCLAGERPYFPARRRIYPIGEIRAAISEGQSVKQIVKTFGVSRSHVYRITATCKLEEKS